MVKLSQFSFRLQLILNNITNANTRKNYVAMLHTGRCGSTVLGNMMEEHSQIFWRSEIFERFMNDTCESSKFKHKEHFVHKVVRDCSNQQASKIYGFETKYLPQQHLCSTNIGMDIKSYLSCLHQIGFNKFILLYRKNYLRQVISVQVGRITKQWHTITKREAPTKVTIDLKSFQIGCVTLPLLDLFDSYDKNFELAKQLLSEYGFILLVYEDDILPDPNIAYLKVTQYLNVDNEFPAVNLTRSNPFKISDMVSNFSELRQLLDPTQYKWMLYD